MTDIIYGEYADYLSLILEDPSQRIRKKNGETKKEAGYKLFERFIAHVKTFESITEKCQRKNLPVTTEPILKKVCNSVGLRIVCGFADDTYTLVDPIRSFGDCIIIAEKDYTKNARPNGCYSYYLIIGTVMPYPDYLGSKRGSYSIEIRLHTTATDFRASLEHQVKYKHDIKDPKQIVRELKCCADESTSCDLAIQTIRDLIQESSQD